MSHSQGNHVREGNARSIEVILVLALIIVVPTIIWARDVRIAWAQSEIVFQEKWGIGENATGVATGRCVIVDALGNIYVAGDATTFSSPSGNFSQHPAVFLLKFDPMGALVWQKMWSSNSIGDDYSSDLAVDSLGNIYVTGSTRWSLSSITGMSDLWLLKFNSSGDLVWQRSYGGGGIDEGSGVAVDSQDRVYVTGLITEFGVGSSDVVLLKVDASGDLIWQKTYGGIHSDYGSDVAADSSGNIYVVGSTSSFGNGMSDILLLKVDASGDLIWQKTWGPPTGSGCVYGDGVAVDSLGDIYVTGTFDNPAAYDILLLKLNPSGDLVWQRIWDGGDWDYADGVAVDSSGSVYVGGYVTGFDVVLLRFDSSGNHIGQVTWGNAAPGISEKCFDIAVDPSGNPVLTGVVEIGPPYTIGYPNGTISESPFGLGVPSFTINTPPFPLYTHNGTVQTPSGSESNTEKISDAFLVKFTPLGYTENYTENSVGVFGLPTVAFYCIIGSVIVLSGALTTVLLLERGSRQAASMTARVGGEKIMAAQPPIPAAQAKNNTTGFFISLFAGIIITINGLVLLLQPYVFFVNPLFGTMGVVGFDCGIMVVLGAVLTRMSGKRIFGSILVILFSIISIYGLGGFFVGFLLGIVGGVLSLAKPERAGPGFVISLAGCSLSCLIAIVQLLSTISYRPSGSWGSNLFAPGSRIFPLIPGGASFPVAMGAIAMISGIVALIGAILIYMPRKEVTGNILVVTFLLISFVALGPPLGVYNIVGIAGGIIGLIKHRPIKKEGK